MLADNIAKWHVLKKKGGFYTRMGRNNLQVKRNLEKHSPSSQPCGYMELGTGPQKMPRPQRQDKEACWGGVEGGLQWTRSGWHCHVESGKEDQKRKEELKVVGVGRHRSHGAELHEDEKPRECGWPEGLAGDGAGSPDSLRVASGRTPQVCPSSTWGRHVRSLQIPSMLPLLNFSTSASSPHLKPKLTHAEPPCACQPLPQWVPAVRVLQPDLQREPLLLHLPDKQKKLALLWVGTSRRLSNNPGTFYPGTFSGISCLYCRFQSWHQIYCQQGFMV